MADTSDIRTTLSQLLVAERIQQIQQQHPDISQRQFAINLHKTRERKNVEAEKTKEAEKEKVEREKEEEKLKDEGYDGDTLSRGKKEERCPEEEKKGSLLDILI